MNPSFALISKDFSKEMKNIRQEINRDNVKEAIKILGNIKIENEKQEEQINLLFGDIYLKLNKPKKALEFYEKSFFTADKEIESLVEVGFAESKLQLGKLEESIEHAEKALNLDPDNLRIQILLAIAKTRNGEKDEALKILNQLYSSFKNNTQVNLAIAGYHSTFDNSEEAIKILEKFNKLKPDQVDVLDELGNLYWFNGNKEKSLDYKLKVLKYYEFNRNRYRVNKTKQWIISVEPKYFDKQKKVSFSQKKIEKEEEEKIKKYNKRKKKIQYEEFDFAYNATGSGFIIGKGKYVITNNHVIADATKIGVRNGNGKISEAEVVTTSKEYDLAILELKKPYKEFISAKSFSPAKEGEDVISIGYPMTTQFGNDRPVITSGIISKVFPDPAPIFITTTDINAGNSGGPIFNLNGNLVGISVATLDKARILKETGRIPTSMGIGIKSKMLKSVFNYSESIPIKSANYKKSEIYEQMLSSVVFVAVRIKPEYITKKKKKN